MANFLPDQINGSNREATKQMIALSQRLIKLKTLHRQRKRVRKEGQRWCETGITLCLRVHWRYYHENNYTACILPPALLRLFFGVRLEVLVNTLCFAGAIVRVDHLISTPFLALLALKNTEFLPQGNVRIVRRNIPHHALRAPLRLPPRPQTE